MKCPADTLLKRNDIVETWGDAPCFFYVEPTQSFREV